MEICFYQLCTTNNYNANEILKEFYTKKLKVTKKIKFQCTYTFCREE